MVLSAAALLFAFGADAAERRLDFATGNGPRFALVEDAGETPKPTAIILHGAMVSASLTARFTHFRETAAAHGYVSVFPEGVGRVWNDGRAYRAGADDVAFISMVVARLIDERIADPSRIYIAGMSNGGIMTFRMMCDRADLFAGAGALVAALNAEVAQTCAPARALPLVMVAGTADPIVPYAGGQISLLGKRGAIWGAEPTAAFFAARNGCGASHETDIPDGPSQDVSIVRIDWACPPTTPVSLYRVVNGGHQAYGGRALPELLFGRTTTSFSAAEAIFAGWDAAAKARRDRNAP